MARDTVKEETRTTIRVSFLDENNSLAAPLDARWSLYNVTTATDVVDWTTISVPSTGVYDITIPASYTRCSTDKDELLSLGVEAEPNTDNQVSGEHELLVKNLRKSG